MVLDIVKSFYTKELSLLETLHTTAQINWFRIKITEKYPFFHSETRYYFFRISISKIQSIIQELIHVEKRGNPQK